MKPKDNERMSLDPGISLFIFRHGQTDWNKEGRIQGHLDVPLNELGRAEGPRLARALKRLPINLVLSSDLSRASETAKLMLAEAARQGWHPAVPIVTDARLREVNLGSLQGLTHSEIHAKFGATLSKKIGAKILSDEDLRELGSERVDDLLTRLLAAIADGAGHPALNARPGSIAISTHGGVLRRLLHFAGGIEEIGFSIPNAVFFPFRFYRKTGVLKFIPRTDFPD